MCGMTPIPLTRGERSALKKLVRLKGSCERRRFSSKRSERFIQLGLLQDFGGKYHLTLRGQVEVLRQRYRHIRRQPEPVTTTGAMPGKRLLG